MNLSRQSRDRVMTATKYRSKLLAVCCLLLVEDTMRYSDCNHLDKLGTGKLNLGIMPLHSKFPTTAALEGGDWGDGFADRDGYSVSSPMTSVVESPKGFSLFVLAAFSAIGDPRVTHRFC